MGAWIESEIMEYQQVGKLNDGEMLDRCLVKMNTLLIYYIKECYYYNERGNAFECKAFCIANERRIHNCSFIKECDKKTIRILTKSHIVAKVATGVSNLKRIPIVAKGQHYWNELRREKKTFDFHMEEGQPLRYFLFELPCFDNLVCNALAYA